MVSSYGTILSINSDLHFQSQVKVYLEDAGFHVMEASTSGEAHQCFNSQHPDLILSDAAKSDDRRELIAAIKQYAPQTPIVMVLEEHDLRSLIDSIREGAWDFVLMPLKDMTVLEHVVCRALERSRLVIENQNYRQQLEVNNKLLSENLHQLEEDHKAGKRLQHQLLPFTPRKIGSLKLSYKMIPSLYLSGDFVDYFEINSNTIGFYIADVSGHGASSAFVTILLKSILDQQLLDYRLRKVETILHPEILLKKISQEIWHAKLGKYLTMIYGVIDLKENKLLYSLGGHYPSPILFDGKKSQFLPGIGFAVGILQDAKFSCEEFKLPKNFTLLLCSDGILEIVVGKNHAEKEKKILGSIETITSNLEDVFDRLGLINEEAPPDDIAMLMIKREVA